MKQRIMGIKKQNIGIGLTALVIMLIVTYFNDLKQDDISDKIESNKGVTTGVIVKYDKWGTANRGADYEFFVDSVLYKGKTGNAPYFKNCLKDSSCIGKKFVVEYWKKDPSVNRILFDKEVKD